MSVTLTGTSLTLDDVVAVARNGELVELSAKALERMASARAVVDRALEAGEVAYGVTTGVGVRKSFPVEDEGHDTLLVRQHLIGQGAAAPRDVARATTLRLANALAQGVTAARPELAAHVVRRLNEDRLPQIRTLGSVGQADLSTLADLAAGLLEDFEPARGEAIALLNQNAFSSAWGALALADTLTLLDAMDVAGALDLEALGANRTCSTLRRAGNGRTRGSVRRSRASPPCSQGAASRGATFRIRSRFEHCRRCTARRVTPSASCGRRSRSSSIPPSRIRSSWSTRTASCRWEASSRCRWRLHWTSRVLRSRRRSGALRSVPSSSCRRR